MRGAGRRPTIRRGSAPKKLVAGAAQHVSRGSSHNACRRSSRARLRCQEAPRQLGGIADVYALMNLLQCQVSEAAGQLFIEAGIATHRGEHDAVSDLSPTGQADITLGFTHRYTYCRIKDGPRIIETRSRLNGMC
jgi:hypothetical protein